MQWSVVLYNLVYTNDSATVINSILSNIMSSFIANYEWIAISKSHIVRACSYKVYKYLKLPHTNRCYETSIVRTIVLAFLDGINHSFFIFIVIISNVLLSHPFNAWVACSRKEFEFFSLVFLKKIWKNNVSFATMSTIVEIFAEICIHGENLRRIWPSPL